MKRTIITTTIATISLYFCIAVGPVAIAADDTELKAVASDASVSVGVPVSSDPSSAGSKPSDKKKLETTLTVLKPNLKNEKTPFFDNWNNFPGKEDLEGYDPNHEKRIVDTCRGLKVDDQTVTQGAFISLVVGPVIDWLFSAVSNSMKKKAEGYTASYKGTLAAKSFYESESIPAVGCFRLTRKRDTTITLDVIGQIKMMETKDAIQIRPLRIFLGEKSAKKADKNVIGVAVKISVVSVFLDDGKPAKETSIDQSLAAANFILPFRDKNGNRNPKLDKKQLNAIKKRKKLKDLPKHKQFAYVGFEGQKLKEWDKFPPLQLPRWSTDRSGTWKAAGQATITVDVAESGDSPTILRVVTKYFEDNKDTLSKLLKEAAEKAVKGDD